MVDVTALGLLLKFWPYIAGAIGLAFAALKIRQSGANAERLKQQQAEAEARDIADQVDNDIGAMPPDEARKELEKWARD
jgi:hypothetical protein